ncbi:speckle-type POZ protein B isoform X1 [Microplitis demolitor]|uniref:speckle-type POZ protein B isoform X1 n=1 Tax=Microplitis demolitor TaxID=69319 RepID=UPI0004CD4D8D|nr:speckle-type POZ protein B isoform X1 [Microplitis demolitor]
METAYSTTEKHNILYEWKINEFVSFLESYKNCRDYGELNSPKFSTGSKMNDSWYLQLQLERDEQTKNKKKWISIFLNLFSETNTKTRTHCVFFIMDIKKEKKYLNEFNTIFGIEKCWGYSKFIEIEELLKSKSELLPSDTLTLCLGLTVYDDYTSVVSKVPLEETNCKITDCIKDLFTTKMASDIVLVVDNRKFLAHKAILMARSAVFFAMFSNAMKEQKENEVNIPDMNPDIFEKMLEFMYTDEITDIDDNDIVDLLDAAEKYQLPSLKELCERLLIQSLNIDNAIKFMAVGDRYHTELLLEYAAEFIAINISAVSKTIEYEELKKSNLQVFLMIIKKFETVSQNSWLVN